ncbi:MAG: CHAT domain-containing protein [Rhizonema sp. PD38]|nr:CHAT domain-containing protein [Rhizonema sp. PD38]
MKKILILSANPKDTSKLRLDEEIREIETALKLAKYREQFEIITYLAIRTEDLRRALLEHQPTIVHFCGHGSGCQGLILENNSGQMQLVNTEALARLFGSFQSQIECVLFNACYSQAQAEAIHQHIDYVIGMNHKIGDVAAIEFATGFYDALGSGKSYEDCFEIACASLDLRGISESSIPVIKARKRSPVSLSAEKSVYTSSTEPQQKPMNGFNQSVSGGQVYGNMMAIQGNNNQQFVRTDNSASLQEKQLTKQQVILLLLQIEQLIQLSPNLPAATKEKSLRYLGSALEEVKIYEIDKQLAAGNLKRMVQTLKNTIEAAVLWTKVESRLQELSVWFGVGDTYFIF